MNLIHPKIKILGLTVFLVGTSLAFAQNGTVTVSKSPKENYKSPKPIPDNLKWSERMMLSEMQRFPQSWMLDFNSSPKWSYPSAIVLDGAEKLYAQTGKKD